MVHLRVMILAAFLSMTAMQGFAQQALLTPCLLEYYRAPQTAAERNDLAKRLQDDVTVAWQLGDRSLAIAVLCTGAAAELPLAEKMLGAILSEGSLGIERNLPGARAWIIRAANRGDSHAKFLLSEMYLEGSGGPVKISEGIALLQDAARDGLPDAQYWLGVEFMRGEHVTRDPLVGMQWLQRASAAGNVDATKMLRELKGTKP